MSFTVRFTLPLITAYSFAVSAQAMSMGEAIRYCFRDGSIFCPSLAHGKAMRACLNENFKQLSPGCQNIVIRLNHGEKLSMF